jgi:hypothetical protein
LNTGKDCEVQKDPPRVSRQVKLAKMLLIEAKRFFLFEIEKLAKQTPKKNTILSASIIHKIDLYVRDKKFPG